MRLALMCNGPFAWPSMRALYEGPHEIVAWVCQPPREKRERKPVVNPMKALAEARGTPIHHPESINTPEALLWLRELNADLFVVTDYGQILSAEALGCSRLGGINLHGSLLPKYRGAAPIQRAVQNGDAVSGVSVIHMTPQLDAGPCLGMLSCPIEPEDTAETLEKKLSELGAGLVLETIAALEAGTAKPVPQDAALASKAPKVKKTEGHLDWRKPASVLKNQIRAFVPWPRSYTYWKRSEGGYLRVILDEVRIVPLPRDARPGEVLSAEPQSLVIAAGEDALRLIKIQPDGKRGISAAEFLRGYPVRIGDQFGPPPESPDWY